MRFEPSGPTDDPQLPFAHSVVDYIFRWLALRFLPEEERTALGIRPGPEAERCPACRALLVREGGRSFCLVCGREAP
jgi:hypothetical protein